MYRLALFTALFCALMLTGCSRSMPATFDHYVMRQSGQAPAIIGGAPIYSATDQADVVLSDGTQLTVRCDVQGLQRGASVTVVDAGDGTYSVRP